LKGFQCVPNIVEQLFVTCRNDLQTSTGRIYELTLNRLLLDNGCEYLCRSSEFANRLATKPQPSEQPDRGATQLGVCPFEMRGRSPELIVMPCAHGFSLLISAWPAGSPSARGAHGHGSVTNESRRRRGSNTRRSQCVEQPSLIKTLRNNAGYSGWVERTVSNAGPGPYLEINRLISVINNFDVHSPQPPQQIVGQPRSPIINNSHPSMSAMATRPSVISRVEIRGDASSQPSPPALGATMIASGQSRGLLGMEAPAA